ncbi:MAG TPA: DNA-formamidopyrimidine glycosylase family protein [Acidobacteriota bacterium]
MPELPEVEMFRRYFDRTSLHQKIKEVRLYSPEIIRRISPKKLREELKGHEFVSTARHGKYLFAQLDTAKNLVLHFGMTGHLKYFDDPKQSPYYVRMLIQFANGYSLAFDCLRKLGRISFANDRAEFIADIKLGPDVLADDFDFTAFEQIVSNKKGSVKSLLMNQHTMAGIGNLYADEILFQSRINPSQRINELSKAKKKRLFDAIKPVLVATVERKANWAKLPKNYLLTERGKEGKCPLCNTPLKRETVAGRTTYWCPRHQRG